MRRMTKSKNPMLGGNMLMSSSGSQGLRRPQTAGQTYASNAMAKLMEGADGVSHIDPATARQQMAARDFQLTPGGDQMGRFQQLAAIRANPAQSGYAQMMAQAGQKTQQPQGMYAGSMAANKFNQGKLAEYQAQGGNGMNIMQRQDGKYALTSQGNQRGTSANSLTGGKIRVYENGSEASLGDTSGQTYQIDADTLPMYRAGAARQQQRIQAAKEANGGLASRDVDKISQIEQMVASGRTTKAQGAAQLRRLQGRHGLFENDHVESVIDRMEKLRDSSGSETSKKSIGDSSGTAFSRPMMSPGKYTGPAVAEAAENVSRLQTLQSIKALGIDASTAFEDDIDSLTSNVAKLADEDLIDWAAMFSEKIAATNGEFLGGDPTANNIANRVAKLVDSGKMEEARAEVQGLQKHRLESQKMKITKPSEIWKEAERAVLSVPIPASPNTGKL